ncbi:MAG: hypothetical protein EPO08_10750 [Rhodospirillaceae bacterium]|nr:MAG: hypothetical protein EPO08_10750 [Rhodospirillaceae bacterium]
MTTPTPAAAPRDITTIEADLDKVFAVIAAAHRLMEDGRLIDLGALDGHIHDACKAALDLPIPDARRLTSKLGVLLDQLDGLETAMHSRFGDLPIMPSHSVGAAAYADMLKHFP